MKVMDLRSHGALNRMIGILGIMLLLVMTSCESEDDNVNPGLFSNGVFVLNEGNWKASNASVSFISHSQDTVYGNLFVKTNKLPDTDLVLGDVLMDMVSVDNLSFLILNNSHNIMVVNNKTFEYVDEITEGINEPRFAEVADGKVFVSQWGNEGEVVVIDPRDLTVKNKIAVGAGPEGISLGDGKLWVANSGGPGLDNTISVIDPAEETVLETIEVGDCPKDVVFDALGNAWSVSAGFVTDWQTNEGTNPVLNRIDNDTYEVLTSLDLDLAVYGRPSRIAVAQNGQTIYFGGGFSGINVWAQGVNDDVLTTEPFLEVAPYSFGVNPQNGDIYCGMAPNFGEPGFVQVYDSEGNPVEKIEKNIGVGPAGFIFVD